MNGEPPLDAYDAYALKISEGPEAAKIRAHLAKRCPVCVPAVRKSLELVAELSAAVNPSEPPRRLRRQILAIVGGRKPGASRSKA